MGLAEIAPRSSISPLAVFSCGGLSSSRKGWALSGVAPSQFCRPRYPPAPSQCRPECELGHVSPPRILDYTRAEDPRRAPHATRAHHAPIKDRIHSSRPLTASSRKHSCGERPDH